jgi:hypothetical protein
LLARPCGDCSVSPHLPTCNTSRFSACVRCKRSSSVDRRLLCGQRPLQMRLTATARGKALAQATAESRCCKTAAASAELDLAKVQRLKDAFAKETCRRAALADVKCHEDALAAEEHQRAALAAAEQEASKFAAIMALLRADMAELARAVEALALVKEPSSPRESVGGRGR